MRRLATRVLAVTLLAAGLAGQPNATTFVIRNVRVFDGERARDNQTVIISDDKSTAVGGSVLAVPPGAQEIAGDGRTLWPGLID